MSYNPSALSVNFGLYEPGYKSLTNDTTLLRLFDGTNLTGTDAYRIELDEQGKLSHVYTASNHYEGSEDDFQRYIRRYPDCELIRVPKNATITAFPGQTLQVPSSDMAVGLWASRMDLGYGELLYLHKTDVQRRIKLVIEQTQEDWREWRASGSLQDFRTWVGDKRFDELKLKCLRSPEFSSMNLALSNAHILP